MQDREPTSRRLDYLSNLADMVTTCFVTRINIFRYEATDMVSERNEGNEKGNVQVVGERKNTLSSSVRF
jgi:hypothetical protein